jgi:hypothetical protein
MADQFEKRRHERVAVKLPVRISTIEPERDPWSGKPFFRSCQESCTNVSRGGAFVHTREPLGPGHRILLELTLPTGRRVEALGRIAWSQRISARTHADGEGVGVEFLGGAPDQLAALAAFVAQHAETTPGSPG